MNLSASGSTLSEGLPDDPSVMSTEVVVANSVAVKEDTQAQIHPSLIVIGAYPDLSQDYDRDCQRSLGTSALSTSSFPNFVNAELRSTEVPSFVPHELRPRRISIGYIDHPTQPPSTITTAEANELSLVHKSQTGNDSFPWKQRIAEYYQAPLQLIATGTEMSFTSTQRAWPKFMVPRGSKAMVDLESFVDKNHVKDGFTVWQYYHSFSEPVQTAMKNGLRKYLQDSPSYRQVKRLSRDGGFDGQRRVIVGGIIEVSRRSL
ncbi:hypothetical protein M231_03693 [Tremella mesenterica]|uniref:Uncharacterized protein n=1 Tax=Tremella mesenterica TaxID=5217 RepID=A0A4Q1BMJ9_TREME|nr:hypothetical protein M231_03693 [Tremella mesenterica]